MRRLATAAIVAGLGCGDGPPPTPETWAREAFVANLAAREDLRAIWALVSRSDLVFDDGFSPIEMIDPTPAPPWDHVAAPAAPVPARPVRWMNARSLIRVRTSVPSRLEVRGRVDPSRVATRPRVTATIDGVELASSTASGDGTFSLAIDVNLDRRTGWSSVYVTLSSVAEPWRDPTELRVARLEWASWQPVTAGQQLP